MISTGSPTLAQMEHALARVVGTRGVAAMLERSRQVSRPGATDDAALRAVSTDLLGATLANQLLSQPAPGPG